MEQPGIGKEIELSFAECAAAVRRRLWLIVLIPALFTLSFWLAGRVERHQAEALLFIQDYPIFFETQTGHRAHENLAASPIFLERLEKGMRGLSADEAETRRGAVRVDANLARGLADTALRVTVTGRSPEEIRAALDLWPTVYREVARPFHFAFAERQLNEEIRQARLNAVMARTVLDAVENRVAGSGTDEDLHLRKLRMDAAAEEARRALLTEVHAGLVSEGEIERELSPSARAYRDALLADPQVALRLETPRASADAVSIGKLAVALVLSFALTVGLVLFVDAARPRKSGERM